MKWNFNKLTDGFDYQGIRDGDIEVFDKTRYQSIVRESIQNSLDARLDKSKPVEIAFNFFSIVKKDHPKLVTIEDRIRASKEWEKANDDDKDLIDQMIREIENDSEEYSCLEISDFNTFGMEMNSTFDSFVHARNVSTKSSTSSAGSKGMGKAAYFAASYLRTLLISSIYHEDNSVLFQGVSRISTHNFQGQEYNYKGFFSDTTQPMRSFEHVPQAFKRTEVGTSIFILGLWPEENRIEIMKRELVNNFWLAILEKDLVVSIGNELINHNNIYDLVLQLYPNLYESGNYNSNPNPRPYFEAYKKINCVQRVYEKSIEELGNVKFVISKNNEYQGRIANFRQSKMLIWKDPTLLYKGYCGVFICDDERGNETLKRLENATHTEWKAGNWKDPKGRVALKAYKEFLKECIDDFVEKQTGEDITIEAFDDLLNLSSGRKGKQGDDGSGAKKVVTTKKPVENESKHLPKSFNWIRNRVVKLTTGFEYHIKMNSKKANNHICFEVLVGSDDTFKTGVDIKSLNQGKFNKNRIELLLDKGDNDVVIQLNDNIKHSIRLKEIDAI